MRQTALAASGVKKGDHIRDPLTGEPVRGRRAAWAALPRPAAASAPGEAPRLAPAAVADALTTAAMLLSVEQIERLCAASPGLEIWILPEAGELRHFGHGHV
jgi:thiamine biosynthesis lipoprotein ApbE